MDVDPSPPSSPREQADSDPYKRAEKFIQDILKARTASQFQQLIEDAAPVNLDGNPQLVLSAEPPSSLAQLINRPGESGGLLSPTEFRFAKFCTEHKLKKRTSDCLLGMLKERALFSKIFMQTLSGKLRNWYQTLAKVKWENMIYGQKWMVCKKWNSTWGVCDR